MHEHVEEEEFNTEKTLVEDPTHGDMGVSLMFRHVCLSPVINEEPWLRAYIFQSTCTLKGRYAIFY